MQIAIDARYLCKPFTSMTVYCHSLLRALMGMELGAPPVVLLPRDLHPSAHPIREEFGDSVRWIRPEHDSDRGGFRDELRWVHHHIPALLRHSLPDTDLLLTVYHHCPAWTPGVRRAVIVHDLCGLGIGFPRYKKAYWAHYLRLLMAAHRAHLILPISESTSRSMATRFPAARPRLGPVVHNGVGRTRVAPRQLAEVLVEQGLDGHAYVVAFATRQKRKNFAATLATLKELRGRGSGLRLVGIAPDREREDVRAWCVAEGVDDAVILSGVSDAELDALYAGAVALLWPSTCEGFGYPVVEAMVQGCPPLVSAVGPGAELVDDAIAPLTSLRPAAMADRLDQLARTESQELERLRTSLRARAAAFTPDVYRDTLREALLRAVADD